MDLKTKRETRNSMARKRTGRHIPKRAEEGGGISERYGPLSTGARFGGAGVFEVESGGRRSQGRRRVGGANAVTGC
jgi:hypothetical protein